MNVNSHDLNYTLNLYQNMQVIMLPSNISNIIVTYTHTPKERKEKIREQRYAHAYLNRDYENFICPYSSCFLTIIFHVLNKPHLANYVYIMFIWYPLKNEKRKLIRFSSA